MAADGVNGDHWRRTQVHNRVCHSRLGEQLLPYLARDVTDAARDEAIAIARACQVLDLATVLTDLALDPAERVGTRRGAIFAVGTMGDTAELRRMVDLAF